MSYRGCKPRLQMETEQMNTTIKIRCNQNKLFGCDQLVTADASFYVIGESRVRCMASVRCRCGLPLAVTRDATQQEHEAFEAVTAS